MYYLAVDIGASSGRHILANYENGKLTLKEIYRFSNGAEKRGDKLIWNVDELFKNIVLKNKELMPDAFIGVDMIVGMRG